MKKINILLFFVVLLVSGCGTLSLETGAKMTNSIILDHSRVKKSVYVQVTNTANSGGERMNLRDAIVQKLQEKGYTIVNSSSDAGLGLFVNVLFANNLKEAKAIQAASGLGVASGVIAMGAGSGTSDSLLIGASAALVGAATAKIMEDETFKAVVDVSVRSYDENLTKNTRIFARAVKMNLNLDEAMPVLEKETSRSIANIF